MRVTLLTKADFVRWRTQLGLHVLPDPPWIKNNWVVALTYANGVLYTYYQFQTQEDAEILIRNHFCYNEPLDVQGFLEECRSIAI